MIIAVDFDGTIVEHAYPSIGRPAPLAFEWLKRWREAGARLILYTMRSGAQLDQAVAFCRENGVEFYAVNENPGQAAWTSSPKVYAHYYIDDAAYGCPLVVTDSHRPVADWSVIGPGVHDLIVRLAPTVLPA